MGGRSSDKELRFPLEPSPPTRYHLRLKRLDAVAHEAAMRPQRPEIAVPEHPGGAPRLGIEYGSPAATRALDRDLGERAWGEPLWWLGSPQHDVLEAVRARQ